MRLPLLLLFAAALSGCLARAAVGVATLPVRAAGAVGDALTTSQDEADRNRGRELRKEERRRERAERRARRERERDERRPDFGG
jgi:hypothetical protein